MFQKNLFDRSSAPDSLSVNLTRDKVKFYAVRLSCTASVFLATCLLPSYAKADVTDKLTFERCSVTTQALELDAECATFKRHENPQDSNSRIIDISVIKLPSYSPQPESDAFTVIQGGPGGSSIDMAIAYSSAFEKIRKKRDVIVMDQRGTKRSNLLNCPIPDDKSLQYNTALVKKLAQECAAKLSQNSDLRYYTTSVAVDDLEALRAAAGYSQLNLYGVSYGTRVVQHYLRKYPDKARTAVIDGVAHVGLNLAGGEIARRWEDSFEYLNARCQRDTDCKQAHGDLRATYQELQARFTNEPVTVVVKHPQTGASTEYTFDEYSMITAMRLMAYTTDQQALLPLLLSETKKGHYDFAAAQILNMEQFADSDMATGMHNSIVCAEDAPFVTEQDRARAKGTLFSELVSDNLRATCDVWPRGVLDDGFNEPFSSAVPVLALSGETDPITPPANGEIAADMLGNAKHISVPGHGHGVLTQGCVPHLVSLFIDIADFDDIDETCTKRERPMPIFTTLTGPKP